MHRLSKRIRDHSSSKIASIPLILEGEGASLNTAAVYITAAAPTRVALAEDEVIRLETVTQAILDVEF